MIHIHSDFSVGGNLAHCYLMWVMTRPEWRRCRAPGQAADELTGQPGNQRCLLPQEISKVISNDGKPMTQGIPGGTVALPAPSALYPSHGGNTAQIDAHGIMNRWGLAIICITQDRFASGRLAFGFDVSFARKKQVVGANADTPALNWNPKVPAPLQAAVQGQCGAPYQAELSAQGASQSGDVTGHG